MEPFLCIILLFATMSISYFAGMMMDANRVEDLVEDAMMGRRRIRRFARPE
jgi:hypothetical protein